MEKHTHTTVGLHLIDEPHVTQQQTLVHISCPFRCLPRKKVLFKFLKNASNDF